MVEDWSPLLRNLDDLEVFSHEANSDIMLDFDSQDLINILLQYARDTLLKLNLSIVDKGPCDVSNHYMAKGLQFSLL